MANPEHTPDPAGISIVGHTADNDKETNRLNPSNQTVDDKKTDGPGLSTSKTNSTLLSLPMKLLLMTLGLLYHKDLVNFVLTSTAVHALADRALLEHRRLSRQFRKVSNMGHCGCLADQVVRLLMVRCRREYTEDLFVTLRELAIDGRHTSAVPDFVFSEFASSLLQPIIDEVYGGDFWDEWKREVEKNNVDYMLATLCLMLPNLKQLSINLDSLECELTCVMLEPIPIYAHVPVILSSNLRTVRINGPGPQAYELLEFCAQIPSVTSLSATNIEVLDPETQGISLIPYISNVKSLTFRGCAPGTRPLVALLNSMQTLEDFSFLENLDAERITQ